MQPDNGNPKPETVKPLHNAGDPVPVARKPGECED